MSFWLWKPIFCEVVGFLGEDIHWPKGFAGYFRMSSEEFSQHQSNLEAKMGGAIPSPQHKGQAGTVLLRVLTCSQRECNGGTINVLFACYFSKIPEW